MLRSSSAVVLGAVLVAVCIVATLPTTASARPLFESESTASLVSDLASASSSGDAPDSDQQPQQHVAEAMLRWKHAALCTNKRDDSAAPLVWTTGLNNYTLARPEGVRSYFLYVPTSFNGTASVSLVLQLHGLGDDALDFDSWTNMTGRAEEWGFLALMPQGSLGLLGTGWNAGTCCVDKSVDDLGFLSTIIGLVNATFPVRQESIHACGFSNGGFMSESLGCHMSGVFRSIASVSGDTIVEWGPTQALAACDALMKSPTSVLHVHGTSDLVVPFTGEILLGWPTIPDDVAAWAKRNACPSAPVQTFNVSTFNNYLYAGCSSTGRVEVELVVNEGGDHSWPRQAEFDTTDYILQFWDRVTEGGL